MRPAFAVVTAIVCLGCSGNPDIQPVPSNEFPSTGIGAESGNRMSYYGMASSDGAWQFAGWHDSDLGLNCELRKLYNGNTYCVPTERIVEHVGFSAAGSGVRYVDEKCATAFLEWDSRAACDAPPPRYAMLVLNEPSRVCGAYNEQHIYRLGEPIEVTAGDRWYQFANGTCEVLSVASPGVYSGLRAVKIDEGEFVQFTETKY